MVEFPTLFLKKNLLLLLTECAMKADILNGNQFGSRNDLNCEKNPCVIRKGSFL